MVITVDHNEKQRDCSRCFSVTNPTVLAVDEFDEHKFVYYNSVKAGDLLAISPATGRRRPEYLCRAHMTENTRNAAEDNCIIQWRLEQKGDAFYERRLFVLYFKTYFSEASLFLKRISIPPEAINNPNHRSRLLLSPICGAPPDLAVRT